MLYLLPLLCCPLYQSCGSGSALFWESGSRSSLEWKAGSGYPLKQPVDRLLRKGSQKLKSFQGTKKSCDGPWTLTTEPWRVYRPVVANSNHFEEELDPGPDPHKSEKLDPDQHLSKSWIRICIKVMQIRNLALHCTSENFDCLNLAVLLSLNRILNNSYITKSLHFLLLPLL